MSWWDTFFTPGDLRAQQKQAQKDESSRLEAIDLPKPNIPNRIDAAHRERRKNAVFFGGIAFTALSIWVTRRSLRRKYASVYPELANSIKAKGPQGQVPHFTQSQAANPADSQIARGEAGMDAAEALFLATLNTLSLFMLGAGSFMKFNNVADVEDLRDFVRSGVGYDVYAGETEADKELEGWVAGILNRDGNGKMNLSKENLTQMMAEYEEMEEKRKAAEAEAAVKGEEWQKVFRDAKEKAKKGLEKS